MTSNTSAYDNSIDIERIIQSIRVIVNYKLNQKPPYANYNYTIEMDTAELALYNSIKHQIFTRINDIIDEYKDKIHIQFTPTDILPNSPITCFPPSQRRKYKDFIVVFYFSFQ